MSLFKRVPELTKKTAAQITDLTAWSGLVANESTKESFSILLSQLQTLIGGSNDTTLYYEACIDQSGTTKPEVRVVSQNTLGQEPTYSYVSPGVYDLTVTGNIFTKDKTHLYYGYGFGQYGIKDAMRLDSNRIRLYTFDTSFSAANDIFDATSILIKIFA